IDPIANIEELEVLVGRLAGLEQRAPDVDLEVALSLPHAGVVFVDMAAISTGADAVPAIGVPGGVGAGSELGVFGTTDASAGVNDLGNFFRTISQAGPEADHAILQLLMEPERLSVAFAEAQATQAGENNT